MPLTTVPFVADRIAKLFDRLVVPIPKPELQFEELRAETQAVVVPTRHGSIPATLYRPTGALGPEGAPIYVNLHGGGFVISHPEQDDPWCRYLASHGVAVLNVDYDVAPKRRFPVAAEQGYDALVWAAAQDWGYDPSRLCVGGQSAGGSLAAAVARQAFEQRGPRIMLQMLHYPVLDLVTPVAEKHTSYAKAMIRPWAGNVFNTAYIPDPARRRDRLASPAWGTNDQGLKGIAPAIVITCEFDRLRDEGVRYAKALDAVGALVEHYDVAGVDHGYNIVNGGRAEAERSYDKIVQHIGRLSHAPR